MHLLSFGCLFLSLSQEALGFVSFDCPAPYGVLDLDVRRVLDLQDNKARVLDDRCWALTLHLFCWLVLALSGSMKGRVQNHQIPAQVGSLPEGHKVPVPLP